MPLYHKRLLERNSIFGPLLQYSTRHTMPDKHPERRYSLGAWI